jgi:hypothetical protein
MTIRFFIYIIMLCSFLPALEAQHEFAPIGAEWVYNDGYSAEDYPWYEDLPLAKIIKCTGDTLIGGLKYKKINNYLVRQDSQQVYFRFEENDYLMYDFDLQVGDTVRYYFVSFFYTEVTNGRYQIIDLDTVIVDGIPIKKFTAVSADLGIWFNFPEYYTYYEKLGSDGQMVEFDFGIIQSWRFAWLRCYQDQEINFKTPKFLAYQQPDCYYKWTSAVEDVLLQAFTLAPNPTDGHLQIGHPDNRILIDKVLLYDNMGRIVLENRLETPQSGHSVSLAHLPAGIYFCQIQSGAQRGVYKVVKQP